MWMVPIEVLLILSIEKEKKKTLFFECNVGGPGAGPTQNLIQEMQKFIDEDNLNDVDIA